MAAFLVALLASAVMTGVSGNSNVKILIRGAHPDDISLLATRPPRRLRVAVGGVGVCRSG